MSVFHNVVRGARDGTCPTRWQSCPGRFPSPLRYTKMAFRRLWHAIEMPHAPSSATQSHGRPSARASTKFLRGVGWLPPRHDGASPPMTTTCATSVLGVCGWSLAPSAAHPASVAHVSNSLGWGLFVPSAASGCAAGTTIRLEQPQSLSTRHTCVPRGRGPTARPISSTHGTEDSTPSDSALTRAFPASLHAPHDAPWAPHSTPRTPGTTSTSARCMPSEARPTAWPVATAHDHGDAT